MYTTRIILSLLLSLVTLSQFVALALKSHKFKADILYLPVEKPFLSSKDQYGSETEENYAKEVIITDSEISKKRSKTTDTKEKDLKVLDKARGSKAQKGIAISDPITTKVNIFISSLFST